MNTKSLNPEQQAWITADIIEYAYALANGYRYCGVELADIRQEACYGLCQAALHFNPDRGVSFKTFATYYIKKYILKAIKDYGSSMRVPREDRQQFKLLSLDVELTRGETRMPMNGEEDELQDMEHGRLEEFIAENDRLDWDTTDVNIDQMMSCLTDKERTAVECLFGLNGTELTVYGTSKVLMVQPERVRQIYRKAISKMQAFEQ